MASEEAPSPTGKAMMKAWRAAEKEAMTRLGFRRDGQDRYVIDLHGDGAWIGGITMPKRVPVRGASRVDLDPINVSVTHQPTEDLIRELTESAPDAPEYVTLPGYRWEILPRDLESRLDELWIDAPDSVSQAVDSTVQVVRNWMLPWMHSRADLRTLLDELSPDRNSPRSEDQRLERAAVIAYQLGDRDQARAAVTHYRDTCCNTGINRIDEPARRFVTNLTHLLQK